MVRTEERMLTRTPALSLVGLLLFASSAFAQPFRDAPPRWNVGLGFIVGDPRGEFATFVDESYGAELTGRIAMDPTGWISLRGDLGFLIYGHESSRVCFEGVGCRVQARLNTNNNIFFGGIGPELAVPMKWGRPYVHAFMGFGYFNTTSSLEEEWGGEDLFTTEQMGDGTVSWGVGGGLEVNLRQGRVPIALNIGARYHENGVMEYLTEGDIVDNPDGSITLYPVRSEANLVSYRFGLTIGLGGSDPGEGRGGGRHR
jgi:hypothetical protein